MCSGVVLEYFSTALGDALTPEAGQAWAKFMDLMIEVVTETGEGEVFSNNSPFTDIQLLDDEFYQKAEQHKRMEAWQGKENLSWPQKLTNLLFPSNPGTLKDMVAMQAETFARRERDRNAICKNTHGPISLLYGARTLFCTVAALLVIILAFVVWPVHDVIHQPSFWWECALQCSVFWTGQKNMMI